MMKSVDEVALQQRLEAARKGSRDEQRAFLNWLNDEGHYTEKEVVVNMMNDEDLEWLKPLAFELLLPAVDIVSNGMRHKRHIFEEDFHDEETNEVVTVVRSEVIDEESVFTPDKTMLDDLDRLVLSQLKTMGDSSLNDLRWFMHSIEGEIEDELCRRGDRDAFERRGDRYRYGDEGKGFFIDYDKAKACYDRAGVAFDPVATAREDRKDATEQMPDFATYHLQGADVPAVKLMLEQLYEKFGEHTEPFMYLPLEVVMKMLVGTNAYVGYIQSIDEEDGFSFDAEFYGCDINCLKYALEQAFPSLEVEVIETQ